MFWIFKRESTQSENQKMLCESGKIRSELVELSKVNNNKTAYYKRQESGK